MWLKYLSILSVLLPFFTGLFFFKKLINPQKIFWGFIIFSIFIEIISSVLSFKHINNYFVLKLFLIFDSIFFLFYFYRFKLSHAIINYLGYFVLVLAILMQILMSNINFKWINESYFFILIILFLIIQSGFVNIEVFDKSEMLPFKNMYFWIASARIIYYLLILFIFIYPSLIGNSFDNKIFDKAFFIINCIANVLLNIMYSKVFYANR
jgi:hypothetical protein